MPRAFSLPRFRRGVWPVPPYVDQMDARLPDGLPDPDRATDCGFACVSAVFEALMGLKIAPGCFREALLPAHVDGRTTPDDLVRLLHRLGGRATPVYFPLGGGSDGDWEALAVARHHRQYRIVLGNFHGINLAHWMLEYERRDGLAYFMDPLVSNDVALDRGHYSVLSSGVHVVVH